MMASAQKPRDIRSSYGRKFPAPATYRTYPKSIDGFTGTVRDQDVEVVFETKSRFKIRAITDMIIANPVRTLAAGKTEMVPKRSIVFKEQS